VSYHPITRTARTAPQQDAIIQGIGKLITSRDPEVPADGYDRVNYRLEIVLDGLYDGAQVVDQGEETNPIRDLLTDLVHLCEARGWDVQHELDMAYAAAVSDTQEWGIL
jgi:hypothetical protein